MTRHRFCFGEPWISRFRIERELDGQPREYLGHGFGGCYVRWVSDPKNARRFKSLQVARKVIELHGLWGVELVDIYHPWNRGVVRAL